MSAFDDEMVAGYLRRLDAAASVLPFDRKAELIEEITAHIAEARTAAPAPVDGESSVPGILDRLGDPADIVRAAAESGSDPMTGSDQLSGGGPMAGADPEDVASGWPGRPASYASAGRAETDLGAAPASGPTGETGPTWQTGRAGQTGQTGRAGLPGLPGQPGALEVCAVVLLLIGGLIVPLVGWIVGVILLWLSPRWTRRDKWIGTLVWPGGLLAPVVLLGLGGIATLTVTSGSSCSPAVTAQPVAVAPGHGGSQASGGHAAIQATQCTSSGGAPSWLIITIAIIALVAAIAGPIYTAVRLLRRARYTAASQEAEPGVLLPV